MITTLALIENMEEQLPLAIILLAIVGKIVLDVLQITGKIGGKHKPLEDKLDKLLSKQEETTHQIDDLWEWHAKEDSDGVKVWYIRQTLEKAIISLADNIALQTKLLEKLIGSVDEVKRKVVEVEKDVDDIRRANT